MVTILPIKTSETKVIDSGTIISFGDSFVEIELTFFNAKPSIFLIFSFLTDEEKDKKKMETTVSPDKLKLEIKLYNFDDASETGGKKPMHIGILEKKDVFLNFRVRKIGESRTIDYTFYQKNE